MRPLRLLRCLLSHSGVSEEWETSYERGGVVVQRLLSRTCIDCGRLLPGSPR